ncbi:MAG TPA: HupE/UreJ family protein, partial [Paracoccaceae bacterium]|nr:HupE/UreJ family protein [Paracoccaceae bacterium]
MRRLLTAAAAALLATPALAHHPMGGAPMETFTDGLLSGVGHPILGFDHLFFIAAVGVAAAFTGRALTAPLGYIAGMLGGCVLIMAGVVLPAVEMVIALSL